MVISEDVNRLVRKQDLVHIAILLTIALGIGVYLIATTVLVAKDGVFYIEQAQKFSSNPVGVIKGRPFGYPFLIFVAHKLVTLFSNSSSVHTWIYSAQGVSLLCRLAALIPLYFIGKFLVGSKKSFLAILILVILPHPARFGSDALRDWPHILLLATGFFLLLWSTESNHWWMLGIVGLAAGLGYLIRPVCAQLVVYGIIWLGYCFLRPAKTIGRSKTVLAVILLLLGFLIPAGPYMKTKGVVLPSKVRTLIKSFSFGGRSNENEGQNPCSGEPRPSAMGEGKQSAKKYVAGNSKVFVDAFYNIYKAIGENLMWVFIVPWLVGIFHHFRPSHTNKGRFLMSVFIGANIVFLLLRCTNFDKAASKRYVLPLIAFTIFYVPTGLELLSCKISRKGRGNMLSGLEKQRWLHALIMIGIVVCLPKLLRPIRIEKQGYRAAANWLKENTAQEDLIAVPDKRISFYAERKGLVYESGNIPGPATYVVKIENSRGPGPTSYQAVGEEHLFYVDERSKERKLIIYKTM